MEPNEKAEDLPMIVYLKGDEDFASEFSINADEAMSRLGIKRSRLTQISGRELRVGKIRHDRYIRPIYRVEDIESYISWTRPTASHKKSSDLLNQALEAIQTSLDSTLLEISKKMESLDLPKNSSFDTLFRNSIMVTKGLLQKFNEAKREQSDQLNRFDQKQLKSTNKIKIDIERLSLLMVEAQSTIDRIETILGLHSHENEELKALIKSCFKQQNHTLQLRLKELENHIQKSHDLIGKANDNQIQTPRVPRFRSHSRLRLARY